MSAAFAQAVAALQSGKVQEANRLCAELLKTYPDNPDVLHLSGVVALECGELDQGEQLLTKAANQAPNNPEIYYNHGSALMKLREHQRAVELFTTTLELAPNHVSALNNLGTVYENLDDVENAEQSYRKVLKLQPQNPSALYNLAQILHSSDRTKESLLLINQALAVRPTHVDSWLLLSDMQLALNQPESAMQSVKRAAALTDPTPANVLAALGRVHHHLGNDKAALQAHLDAVDLAPGEPEALITLGQAYAQLSMLDDALDATSRALAISPDHRAAMVNLAQLYELASRTEDCRKWSESGLDRYPEEARFALLLAKCDLREGQYQTSLSRLEDLESAGECDAVFAKELAFTRAAVLDKLDQPELAFLQFARGNAIALNSWQNTNPSDDSFLASLDEIDEVFSETYCAQISDCSSPVDHAPAFLLGFQRSGTTLLDTMLGGHSQVHVMEELPVLSRVIRLACERFGDYPAVMPELDDSALAELRAEYFRQASELCGWSPASGQLLLDKSPLHIVHLGMIHRLFPGAPVVLALRHPYDVCLSCFMQDFELSSLLQHYASLQGVATVYQKVMSLWLMFSDRLKFPRFELKYEALVEAPQQNLKAVVDFLCLNWESALSDHQAHAQQRGLINTPSYHQVNQPVYRSARYRWKRYQSELQDVLPILHPFAEQFGYQG